MSDRPIWLTDATGQRDAGPMADALPTEVWQALYERIMANPALTVLQRIWREQWGPEGDVAILPSELSRLRAEIAQLLPGISSAACRDMLDRLSALSHTAEARGGGLLFYAD